jgi:LmbE family N-acetylglucosaminyl deacetylase
MANETSQLVLAAHPNDETLGFSSVCTGADVVSVTDGGSQGRAEEFRHACQLLWAKPGTVAELARCLPPETACRGVGRQVQRVGAL